MRTSCTVGGMGGAFVGGYDKLEAFSTPLLQISFVHVLDIALTAFIGVVVTYLGRKLLDHLWNKFKRKK